MFAAPVPTWAVMGSHLPIVKHLSWIHPQFYNNKPNSVDGPRLPPPDPRPTPWTVRNWQAKSQGRSFWAGIGDLTMNTAELPTEARGMLIPVTCDAASVYNTWNITLSKKQVINSKVFNVGT